MTEQTFHIDDISFQFAWPATSPERAQRVKAFWTNHGALTSVTEQTARANEILGTAEIDGELKGVCTAFLAEVPDLSSHFYHYRTFAAPGARLQDISLNLLRFSFEFLGALESTFESTFDSTFGSKPETALDRERPKAAGIYFEVENARLRAYQNEGIWFQTRFLYLGDTAEGWHRRVRYFDHSCLA